MRMTVLHRDEDGAVLVIVAFILIGLMGFAALVVDVGGLLVKRRQMVRAADAAALAAAQSCARRQGDTTARATSSEYAGYNVNAPAQTRYQYPAGNCDSSSGTVAVAYTSNQPTYFVSVLGLADSYPILGEARALWGPAGAGAVPPLMTSSAAFQGDCDIDGNPDSVAVGTECSFWYDREDLGSSTWGWLSLFQEGHNRWGWNVPPDHNCSNSSAAQRNEWIENPVEVPPLNYPGATYVCVDTGLATSNWNAIRELIADSLSATGNYPELMFPVNDFDGSITGFAQVDKDGNPTATRPDKYNVVGFVTLKVIALYDGDEDEVIGTPGTAGTINTCPGYPQDHTFTRTNDTWDMTSEIGSCLALAPAGSTIVEPPDVSGSALKWSYDSSTDVLQYTGFSPNEDEATVSVTLDYQSPATEGTPGVCGTHYDGDKQDKCLVTEWIGFTTTGQEPGQGADFGSRPVQLIQ